MLEHTDTYITKCVDLGILSPSPFRKYPLRPLNLALVLKAYAITAGLPYSIDHTKSSKIAHHKYYLTDSGLEWLYETFSSWSLPFLRSLSPVLFINCKNNSVIYLKSLVELNNFRGLSGIRPRAGTKQGARLIHQGKGGKKVYDFESLFEARKELILLLRYYKISDFKLYRTVKTDSKLGYKYRPVSIILDSNTRGIHLRGDKQ